MGAANSVRMLYKDSFSWFRQYIDAETYMEDFKSMDKHHENALSFVDVRDWIIRKSSVEPSWNIFLTSGPVLAIAHQNACKHGDSSSCVSAPKVVDVIEFKTLLVHLFAVSILWRHFLNADQWEESGAEKVGTKQLNFEAFKLACRTLSSANAKEDLSDEQIQADFLLLDGNCSNTIGFTEVCNYCCKFIDDPEIDKKTSHVSIVPKFFGDVKPGVTVDQLQNMLTSGPKTYNELASIEEKNKEMIAALISKLAHQDEIMEASTKLEHQNNVRRKYPTINDMINHPICCGFLLQFCESQHNAENLYFIREVDEFRDLFSVDNEKWNTDWRDLDIKVQMENDTISEELIDNDVWISNLEKEIASKRIESILSKYLRDDAQNQVCVSKCVIARTLKRVKLLYLYGPSIFDEACNIPILTMNKDVLPRYQVSDIMHNMIVRVASSEPVPPGRDLNVPPPENLLLHLCSAEAFPDTRCFTQDELIGSQHLYDSFLTFLQGISKEKADKLLCIRKIDIFEELMHMNCTKEATEEAWQIYRYYVAQGSAFEIPIPSLDRKYLMLSLANPKKNMFTLLRETAYLDIKADFDVLSNSQEYREFPRLMRDMKAEIDAQFRPLVSPCNLRARSQSYIKRTGVTSPVLLAKGDPPLSRRILSTVHLALSS